MISLFPFELEEPKIGISGKGLTQFLALASKIACSNENNFGKVINEANKHFFSFFLQIVTVSKANLP